LQTCGEALTQMSNMDPGDSLPHHRSRRIIAFRNMLVHGNGDIDHGIVWSVLEQKLPPVTSGSTLVAH